MTEFEYRGDIPGSKSVFNRALIVKSYFPDLVLKGFAECDDVRFMRQGLSGIQQSEPIDCGEGGTTFRFMALRVARESGTRIIRGSERLLSRPQKGLVELLHQLGAQTELSARDLKITCAGWQTPKQPIQVDTSESSQYASALLLNAWLLDFDLCFELVGDKVSESYFLLTLEMVRKLGMQVEKTARGFRIPAGQKIKISEWIVEPDMSSMFTMAAAAALCGRLTVENFPSQTSQPDVVFLEIFKKMQVHFHLEGHRLLVQKSPHMQPVNWNLSQSPDLFPVLAALCSWVDGVSRLDGAPHLTKKESNRIQKVADLLSLLGVPHEILHDGMIIHGKSNHKLVSDVTFNPDKDHRMVMAATLMNLMGHKVKIEESEVINKSFPEFWNMIGIQP